MVMAMWRTMNIISLVTATGPQQIPGQRILLITTMFSLAYQTMLKRLQTNTNVRVLYIPMSSPVARYLGTICPGAGCPGDR